MLFIVNISYQPYQRRIRSSLTFMGTSPNNRMKGQSRETKSRLGALPTDQNTSWLKSPTGESEVDNLCATGCRDRDLNVRDTFGNAVNDPSHRAADFRITLTEYSPQWFSKVIDT